MEEACLTRDHETSSPTGRPAPPKVGDAATFTVWTDREACTVIEVRRKGREIVLQRDKAKLLNGFDSGEPDALTFTPGGFCGYAEGHQRYAYASDPNGDKHVVSLRKRRDGTYCWKEIGQPTHKAGGFATFGERSESYDFNF